MDAGKQKKSIVKTLLSDTVWCTAGVVLMNVVIQFLVYPVLNRRMGDEGYGDMLYLMSLLTTVSYAAGAANNLSRMKDSAAGKTKNAPYLLLLAGASLLMIPLGAAFCLLGGARRGGLETGLFVLLMIFTAWRYYAEVEYRLTVNYRGYFCYYLVISLGYLAGAALFLATGVWPVALLLGEIASVLFVLWRGSALRWDGSPDRATLSRMLGPVAALLLSTLLSELILNSDRILLKLTMGGASVTVFYLASLLGKTVTLVTKPFNSVIMGYLARYRGTLSARFMHLVTAASLAACALATVCCTVASHILIRLLYPQSYALAKPYFIVANLSQIFCFAAGVVGVVLLRFARTRDQVYLNGAYAAAFLLFCIPGAVFFGFDGFCAAMLLTGFTRYAVAIFLGYRQVARSRREAARERTNEVE